ncbi:acyltransferase [Corynebacterium sp. MC3]|uniref:acyltransferase family protein n=1 Tax=Corynebacterium sp. MC3 TaxID=1720193 RepID=UPI000B0F9594|nr:acyltransferase [Corynebacterium sp. MC3]
MAFQTATDSPVLARFDYFVAVFFALSAFLLARGEPRPAREYYWRRVARIVPAYVVSVAIIVVTLPPLAGVRAGPLLANLTLTQLYVSGGLIDGLTQHWSLCVEVAFYLCLFFTSRWVFYRDVGAPRSEGGRAVVLAVAVAAALVWPHLIPSPEQTPGELNLQIWPISFAPWFAVGLLCAEVERAGHTWRLRVPGLRWVFPALSLPVAWAGGVLGPAGLEHPSAAEFNVRVLLGALFAALWIVPFALAPRLHGTALCTRPAQLLGRWSYSLFLWHMAVLYFVFPILGVGLFDAHFVPALTLTVLLSLVVSYLSYSWVEVPGAKGVHQLRAGVVR